MPGSPYDRAARGSPTRVADVRGTEAAAPLPAVAVAPECPEGACAAVLVGLDLQVARRPFRLAHGVDDPLGLGAANELRAEGRDFPRISLEGHAGSQLGHISRA